MSIHVYKHMSYIYMCGTKIQDNIICIHIHINIKIQNLYMYGLRICVRLFFLDPSQTPLLSLTITHTSEKPIIFRF